MSKKKYIISLILLLILSMFFPVRKVLADEHTLEDIEILVYINDDGSARITEKRNTYLTEGTENFIVIGNLGDSEIIDFEVWEDGKLYEYVENWNIDDSREEKANKNGIIEESDRYELSWGIGEYGRHDYEIQYTITNFVKQFQDRQGISWRFINEQTNIPPKNAKVIIESDKEFLDSNSGIWAFGYEGYIQYEDGKIIATSNKAFERDDYLTILVELEEEMYNTSSKMIDKPFEEVKDEAFEGSDYGSDTKKRSILGNFLFIIGNILPYIIFIIGILLFSRNRNKDKVKARKYRRKYKEEYYRDYPYDGDFEEVYYILNEMRISDRETLMTGFILKWIDKGYISVEKAEKGFIFKKEETALKFIKKNIENSTIEGSLYNMMLQAAGSNEILESNEFTKWAKKHYRKIERWEKRAKDESLEKLQDLDYVDFREKKVLFFKTHDFAITDKGEDLEEKVHKFVNYLYDFSLLNEHESINVGIWDNLMIWAGVLGITKVVAKEFEKLYPEYKVESIYRGNSIYMVHSFSRSASRAVASRAATNRSSGSGGFSSSGGGGGSFGGGSGGGTR